MPLPPTIDSIAALNGAYAALVFAVDKRLPGFSDEMLSVLDALFEKNKDLPGGVAIAQLASGVKTVKDANA